MFEFFTYPETWVALLTLTFLEIVLGIDNIIFISITAGKLPENQIKKATNIGLMLAMVFRIILLLGVSYLVAMKDPIFNVDYGWLSAKISGQSLVLFAGGIFYCIKAPAKFTIRLKERKKN